jgi:hypothetical protein
MHSCPDCGQACSSAIDGPHDEFLSSDETPQGLSHLVEINKQDRGRSGWRPFVESIFFECTDLFIQTTTTPVSPNLNFGYTLPKKVDYFATFVDMPTQPLNPPEALLPGPAANLTHYWLARMPTNIFNPVAGPTGEFRGRRILFRGLVSFASMLTDGASPGIQIPRTSKGNGWQDVWCATAQLQTFRMHSEVNIRWLSCSNGCSNKQ